MPRSTFKKTGPIANPLTLTSEGLKGLRPEASACLTAGLNFFGSFGRGCLELGAPRNDVHV